MPIPFRDHDEVDELGAAGFLRLIGDAAESAVAGGLLLVDARTEPLELVHHWMTLPSSTLWSADEARRHIGRRVTTQLFRSLGRTPEILFFRDETGVYETCLRQLEIGIPVAFVEESIEPRRPAIRWLRGGPVPDSPGARLYERLAVRELLEDPFHRLGRALRELHPSLFQGPGS